MGVEIEQECGLHDYPAPILLTGMIEQANTSIDDVDNKENFDKMVVEVTEHDDDEDSLLLLLLNLQQIEGPPPPDDDNQEGRGDSTTSTRSFISPC